MTIERPTSEASRLKRRRQRRSLSTTTRCPGGSSSTDSTRPASGCTPRSGSRLAVTAAPITSSGAPDSARFMPASRSAASPSNVRVRRRQSKNVPGDTRAFAVPKAEKSSNTIASRSGSAYGSGRMTVWSSVLKSAALAPMPSARTAMTATEKPGVLRSSRNANRMSATRLSMNGHWTDRAVARLPG